MNLGSSSWLHVTAVTDAAVLENFVVAEELNRLEEAMLAKRSQVLVRQTDASSK